MHSLDANNSRDHAMYIAYKHDSNTKNTHINVAEGTESGRHRKDFLWPQRCNETMGRFKDYIVCCTKPEIKAAESN